MARGSSESLKEDHGVAFGALISLLSLSCGIFRRRLTDGTNTLDTTHTHRNLNISTESRIISARCNILRITRRCKPGKRDDQQDVR
jgi:hypothetical protein